MKRLILTVLIACVLVALASTSSQGEVLDSKARRTSLDARTFYYSFTDGSDRYGPWWGSSLRVLNAPARGLPGLTGIFEMAVEKHDDPTGSSSGLYMSGGGYYDWNDRLFSFSTVGFGTAYPFVKFNVHHELDYKIPPEKSLVLAAGGGYVDYYGVDDSPYFSIGSAYYWRGFFEDAPQVILQYRLRRYFTSPADKQLNAHTITAEFRWEDGRATLFRYMRGREAYAFVSGAGVSFDLDQGGEAFTVEYKQNINDRLGIAVGFNYIHKFRIQEPMTIFSAPGGEFRISWNL